MSIETASKKTPLPKKPDGSPKPILMAYKDVATALVRQHGIHEGLWGIYVEFGIQGVNMPVIDPEGDIVPAAIVPVLKVGLQAFDEETNISVDAAKVNPAMKAKKKKARPSPDSK
ncbi:MAG: hypothetical protein ABI882_15220 [Acidobacteriota bacterium]